MTGAIDDLLEELSTGDPLAVEQVFVTYEPYLRKVVRRLLPCEMRARFDSCDVVQSVWGQFLHGFRESGWRFTNAAQLKAFLVTITRRRLIDRYRQHSAAMAREQTVARMPCQRSGNDSASDPARAAEATELWERILSLCPPEHHELLRLKRSGFSNVEIADRIGLHAGSVRRILRDLSARIDEEIHASD